MGDIINVGVRGKAKILLSIFEVEILDIQYESFQYFSRVAFVDLPINFLYAKSFFTPEERLKDFFAILIEDIATSTRDI